jgi:replicative DNA helicase
VKQVIVSLDNDPGKPKHEATERALELLRTSRDIKGYVIDPPALSPHKDIDEYWKAKGLPAVKALVAAPLTDAEYTAGRILARYDIKQAIEYDRAKEELLTFADNDFLDYSESSRVIDLTVSALNISRDTISEELTALHSKRSREKERDIYATLERNISGALRDGDVYKVRGLVEDARSAVDQLSAGNVFPEPFGPDTYTEHLRKKDSAGYRTGYPTLDTLVRIRPGAVTLIGGRPGHGKTSFMLNLLVNMLRNNEYKGKTLFFFTYEEPAGDLATKIINRLAGVTIDAPRNTDAIEAYFRKYSAGNGDRGELNSAYVEFSQYVKSKRLYLVNEPYNAEALTAHLSALAGKYEIGPVFIDYMQKVNAKDRGYASRQVEIQHVSNMILNESAIRCNLPIIAGAQLNRTADVEEALSLDQFREAGDLEQDANTALFVWNKKREYRQLKEITEDIAATDKKKDAAREKLALMGEYGDSAIPFNVHVMKNRGGPDSDTVEMVFNAPVLTITEKGKASEDNSGF